MATRTETLAAALAAAFDPPLTSITVALGEVTAVVAAERLSVVMRALRDRPEFRFESLIDACGVDY